MPHKNGDRKIFWQNNVGDMESKWDIDSSHQRRFHREPSVLRYFQHRSFKTKHRFPLPQVRHQSSEFPKAWANGPTQKIYHRKKFEQIIVWRGAFRVMQRPNLSTFVDIFYANHLYDRSNGETTALLNHHPNADPEPPSMSLIERSLPFPAILLWNWGAMSRWLRFEWWWLVMAAMVKQLP